MISFEPRVVVVDDKIDEVIGILENYREEGIGVKYYNAHLGDPTPKPVKPFSDLNLIFLDIHYTDNSQDYDPSICAGWIDSLISENAFYILVIWSKETDKTNEILNEIRLVNKEPFLCLEEQKTEYFAEEGGFDFSRLTDRINERLAQYPQLEEVSIWKTSVQNSTNKIIGHLVKNADSEALTKKLQKIVIGHGGHYLIGKDREIEKRNVLFDALDSILASNSKLTRPEVEISELNKDSLYNIPKFPETDVDSRLNSWFHFKLIDPSESDLLIPGLISYIGHESLKKNYNISEDDGIQKFLPFQFNGIGEGNTQIEDICILISRPCDIAQNKFGRNLKFLSGILIKNPIRKENNDLKTNKAPVSVKVYDHLSISDEFNDCAMVFDFRYAFSLPPDIFKERFTKFKIFNKELLSEIQVEYSSYSSRLGITQII